MSDESGPPPPHLISPSGLDQTAPAAMRDEAPQLEPGASVGRYRITEVLGVGGMGVVYCAWDSTLKRKVALKLIKARTNEIVVQARFEREAQAMARLSHRNVVGVHDFGIHQGQPYLVMEFVEGTSLRAWLGAAKRPWRETLKALIDAAHGLGAAHAAGLVHRDFKPENVLVGDDGRVAVTDLGLARSFDEALADSVPSVIKGGVELAAPVTIAHAVMGTPLYMAPEQFSGEPTDARTDIFAFGIVVYEALYGQRPFPFKTPTEPITLESMKADVVSGKFRPPPRRRGVPRRFVPVIEKLLAPRPGDRPAAMDEVVQLLERAVPVPRAPFAIAAALLAAPVIFLALPFFAPDEKSDNPEAQKAWLEGIAQLQSGSTHLGQRSLRRATTLDPHFASAHLWAAFVDDDPARARREFEVAQSNRARLSGSLLPLLNALGPGLVNSPNLDDWLATVTTVIGRHPRDANLRFVSARVHQRRGETEAALADLDEAARLDATLAPTAIARRGALEHGLHHDAAAKAAWDQCLAMAPGATDCLAGQARRLSAAGSCAEVEDLARRWKTLDPSDREAQRELANALFARGQWSAAKELLEAPIDPEEDVEFHWFDAYRVAFIDGDFAAARRIADEALRKTARGGGLMTSYLPNMAVVATMTETGDTEAAAALADQVLGRAPAWTAESPREAALVMVFLRASKAGKHTSHAQFLARRQELLAGAERARSSAGSKLDPLSVNQPWITGYAWTADTPEDAREALEALPQYLPLPEPGVRAPDTDLNIGKVFSLAGQPERALPYLKSALGSCHPIDNPLLLLRGKVVLGRTLEALGDRKGATEAYQSVVKQWGKASPPSIHAREAQAALDRLASATP